MPRGRNGYGPGFWKEPGWYPGAGGYMGGYGYGPGPGWGLCRWGWAGAGPYYGPGWAGPQDEKAFLQEQAEALKAELAELEKRLSDMEKA
ncbi:MAG: DUF5320 domain-containing protein [Bacillota bacterium]